MEEFNFSAIISIDNHVFFPLFDYNRSFFQVSHKCMFFSWFSPEYWLHWANATQIILIDHWEIEPSPTEIV